MNKRNPVVHARRLGQGSLLWGLLFACVSGPALGQIPGRNQLDVDLRPERDTLIGKIAAGQDLEESLNRFAALLKERQQRLNTAQGLAEQAATTQKELRQQRQGLDAVVGEKCALSADPRRPPPGSENFMRADWGTVTVKQEAELAGRKLFDPPRKVTLYKIAGLERTYVVSSEGPRLWFTEPFSGSVGDLVLVCHVSVQTEGSGSHFPADFRQNILQQGFVAHIKDRPLIAEKKRQNPVHVLRMDAMIHQAVLQGAWRYPAGQSLVGRVMVKQDLGVAADRHRYLMGMPPGEFVLEVAAPLKNSELLRPYAFLWVIMAEPKPDLERKTWILTAEDIEAHYTSAVPPSGVSSP
jgi:hypothetical protein